MTDQSSPQAVPAGWHVEPATGQLRWWDGANWGVYQYQVPLAPNAPAVPLGNGFAVAAFVLGLWGFVTTWVPFGIGLLLGGLADVLAIVFGIIGIVRANRLNGRGMALAVLGLVFGGLAFLSIFIGAGTIW